LTLGFRRAKTPEAMDFARSRWSRRSTLVTAIAASSITALAACAGKPAAITSKASAPAAPGNAAPSTSVTADTRHDHVRTPAPSRRQFNQAAAELALPIFWTSDANANGAVDPNELSVYWGLIPGAKQSDYVANGQFTARARQAIAAIHAVIAASAEEDHGPVPSQSATTPTETEQARRKAIQRELRQSRITLVETDLSNASAGDKTFVELLTQAAERIEDLYAKQLGTFALRSHIPADDPASLFAFYRNQSPRCVAPETQSLPECSAIAITNSKAPSDRLSGLYPADRLSDRGFCDQLSALAKKAPRLVDPFHVVASGSASSSALRAVPYHEAFREDAIYIQNKLEAAAAALDSNEVALKTYLVAAAKAFVTDAWWQADEAWARMNAHNSKYYLRIGPDEVYREPCATKALYHVSFGLINQGSLAWQRKLDPLKGAMEQALAKLAGAPYKARNVDFKLPDFVDIAINAGDSRPPDGATIGQSLPNFGPVANEGRGRTAAMINFYTDPDSIEALQSTTASLFCADAMKQYTTHNEPLLMSTLLHEAAHNLGPAHQYKVRGNDDRAAFGGPLASTLEELKAQTAALYFTTWLAERGEITREQAAQSHVRDVVWSFGHISRGMYDEDKKPRNYSQLAAIQLGWLKQRGAVTWKSDETAANRSDRGCFSLHLDRFPDAVASLMSEVAQIKARGDKPRAQALVQRFVDVEGDAKALHDIIATRVRRAPKPSFVYAVRLHNDAAAAGSK